LEGSVPQSDEIDDDEVENGQNRTESSQFFNTKYRKLTTALCEVVDDFGLVSFIPLNIQDKQASIYLNVDEIDSLSSYYSSVDDVQCAKSHR